MNSGDTEIGPEWVQAIVMQLDRWESEYTSKSYLTELDNLPNWVDNVVREIARQQFPALRGKTGKFGPDILGRLLGQQCAKLYSFGDEFSKIEAKLTPELRAHFEKVLHEIDKAEVPVSPLVKHVTEFCQNPEQIEIFAQICHSAFRSALEQESYIQAVEFFVGFAEGLKNWKDIRGAFTDATPIYQILYLRWPDVEQLGSVSELRTFLRSHCLTQDQIGHDPKRLQKICERIGLKFRSRGRPRTKKSDIPKQ
jgi:hypothetical protein